MSFIATKRKMNYTKKLYAVCDGIHYNKKEDDVFEHVTRNAQVQKK